MGIIGNTGRLSTRNSTDRMLSISEMKEYLEQSELGAECKVLICNLVARQDLSICAKRAQIADLDPIPFSRMLELSDFVVTVSAEVFNSLADAYIELGVGGSDFDKLMVDRWKEHVCYLAETWWFIIVRDKRMVTRDGEPTRGGVAYADELYDFEQLCAGERELHPAVRFVREFRGSIDVLRHRASLAHVDKLFGQQGFSRSARGLSEVGVATRASRREAFVAPRLTAKGWSKNKWAIESGVEPRTVYGYMKGKTKLHPASRSKLSDALGVEAHALPD